jgi:molybdate transport system ATP-binding protein
MIEIDIYVQRPAFTLDIKCQCEGPVTALCGPSGAGKTTLLNVIAGLLRPQRGYIRIDDVLWCDTRRNLFLPPHRRRLGYVFQDARLFPHLSVRHNLIFSHWVRRPPQHISTNTSAYTSATNIEWDDVIDVLGLAHLLERAPLTLSGGEQQRVALGRALLAYPSLLLMDEPLAAVDAQRRNEILPYIERVQKLFSIPTVYVSHTHDEVERIADEIITLGDGKVQHIKRGSVLM